MSENGGIPHDFTFRLDQVEFVIVDTYKDVAQFPRNIKNEIGREKFLIMKSTGRSKLCGRFTKSECQPVGEISHLLSLMSATDNGSN